MVFDGEPRSDAEIRIHVLPEDSFEPLDRFIGWLNCNLRLQLARPEIWELITELEAADRGQTIYEWLELEAESAKDRFEKAAGRIHATIVEQAVELLAVMTHEIASLTRDCRAGADEIRRLHRALKAIRGDLAKVGKTTRRLNLRLHDTDTLAKENLALAEELVAELRRLDQRRAKTERTAQETIAGLERTLAELRQRLADR